MRNVVKRPQQWRVYKPKPDGTGAASRVELKVVTEQVDKKNEPGQFTVRDVQLFWVASPQIGKDTEGYAAFAWKDKDDQRSVTLKLGEPDIGELLAVLNGRKKQVGGDKGIFHQNDKGNTSFTFSYNEQYNNFNMRLAKKVDGKVTVVQHTISVPEAEILRVLLEEAVRLSYQW